MSSASKDIPVVRCRDCECYPPESFYEEAVTKYGIQLEDIDLVCEMWMSDGFSPFDGCTHGRKRASKEEAK